MEANNHTDPMPNECSRDHPPEFHRETPHGRAIGVTCQVDGCNCHFELRGDR